MIGQNLFFVLNNLTFPALIRGFFGPIVKFLYFLIAKVVDFMYSLTTNLNENLNLENYINQFTEKFYVILIIFMIFKITVSLMNYLVNPDSFSDKNTGISKLIPKIVISISLLLFINPAFELLKDIETTIVDNNIVDNFFSSNYGTLTLDDIKAYPTKISERCDEDLSTEHKDSYIWSFSKGDRFSVIALRPFFQPQGIAYNEGIEEDRVSDYKELIEDLNEANYCGYPIDKMSVTQTSDSNATEQLINDIQKTPNSASDLLTPKLYLGQVGDHDIFHEEDFKINFNYIWALIVGIVILLIVISFCFDIVIRYFTLFIYQVIAPIPIISYISPKSKDSEMLGNWLKKLLSVWASLFMRIVALNLALMFIGIACDSLKNGDIGLVTQLVIIIGSLMFAKKLPQLLEEVIPGLKLGNGFELNPFKRIQRDALGGNLALAAASGVAAYGLGAATNAGHRLINTGMDIHQNGFSFRRLGSGIVRTAGSAISGGTRAGINAFGRTSRDGRLFRGMWDGYQTSMFSKLQREDNFRKTGYEDTVVNHIRAGAESTVADMARYAGVLNAGQREYLRAAMLDNDISAIEQQKRNLEQVLADDKRELELRRRERLEPYTRYADYASRIKNRIENDKKIKKLQDDLEDALATGDDRAIRIARNRIDTMKKVVSRDLFANDAEVIDLASRLDQLRANHTELRDNSFNYKDASGSFSSGAIYNVQNTSNIIQRQFDDQERAFATRQTDIDALQSQINNIKDSEEYERTHNDMSPAKLANASRMNREPQGPGFKPSTTESSQSRVTDSSRYSNLGHNHHGNGGPPPPPPGTP